MTMKELTEKLGRQPSVNEWRVANGKAPLPKKGRKVRGSGKASEATD